MQVYPRMRVFILSILASAGPASFLAMAQEADPPENRFVLRISREFIRKHMMPTIEETRPVDRYLFGAHVTGEAKTVGTTSIVMDVVATDALFTFRFTGSTVTKSQSRRDPVVVQSTSRVDFVAERLIRFDGVKFFEEPATIEATVSSSIDCIGTPRGLIGRIVRKRALPVIEANRPAGDAIAMEGSKKRVLASFNAETSRMVTDLNQIVPLEKTLALFVPKTKEWVNHLGSTKEFIMVSPGPKDASIPILPKEYMRMKAPVEFWIRGKPEGESTRRAVEMWGVFNRGLDRFRTQSVDAAANDTKKVEGLKLTAVGEWWVVKVGEDLVLDLLEGSDEPTKN